MAAFDEETNLKEIISFLELEHEYKFMPKIIGYSDNASKKKFDIFYGYEAQACYTTFGEAIKWINLNRNKSKKLALWFEVFASSANVKRAEREGHCNVFLLDIVHKNEWDEQNISKFYLYEPHEHGLLNKSIQKFILKVWDLQHGGEFYEIRGNQADDRLCRNYCKKFIDDGFRLNNAKRINFNDFKVSRK